MHVHRCFEVVDFVEDDEQVDNLEVYDDEIEEYAYSWHNRVQKKLRHACVSMRLKHDCEPNKQAIRYRKKHAYETFNIWIIRSCGDNSEDPNTN